MRRITHIVLHCTATPQNTSVESILRYWAAPPPAGQGWKKPGYHRIIPADGATRRLLPDAEVSNGVAGHNATSVHISYIGGVDAHGRPVDNRTPQQLAEMIRIVTELTQLYPDAVVVGHRDFPGVKKACPSFDARSWWASVS